MANFGRALANANESDLRVFSTGDLPDVYEDSFMAVAKPDGTTFRPTLILVGTRLGIDKINQVYLQALIATLQMPQSIGIAGYIYIPFPIQPRRPQSHMLTLRIEAGRPRPTTSWVHRASRSSTWIPTTPGQLSHIMKTWASTLPPISNPATHVGFGIST
jgi:hypothetical protein